MSADVLIYLLIFAAATVYGWLRSRERHAAFRKFASQHGLEAEQDTLDGVLDGRRIHARRVSSGWGRRRRHSLWIELELRTPPQDLRLATEGVISTLSKVAGNHDLSAGDPSFDREFLIRCDRDIDTLAWLTVARKRELLDLHQTVEQIAIDEKFLTFEIPADPYHEDDLDQALQFARVTAERVDDPDFPSLRPQLKLHGQRAKRGKWAPLWGALIRATPLVLVGLFAAWYFITLRDQIEQDPAQQNVLDERSGTALTHCLEELYLTWDVDVETCADEADAVEHDGLFTLQPLEKLQRLRIRKASRVFLDREAAATALTRLATLASGHESGVMVGSHGPSYRAPDRNDLAALAWDAGLTDEYLRLETPREASLPDVLLAVATFGGDVETITELSGSRETDARFDAIACIHGLRPVHVTGTSRLLVSDACEALLAVGRVQVAPGRAWTDDRAVHYLLQHPDAPLDSRVARSPARFPRATTYHLALELSRGEKLSDSDVEHFRNLEPISCGGAWSLGESYGDPEVWKKAAGHVDSASEQMRILAAMQAWKTGRATELGEFRELPHAICAAQLEVARGDAAQALARLEAVDLPAESSLLPLMQFTRAQAHLMTKDWNAAATAAAQAAQGFSTRIGAQPLHDRAALFAIAANVRAQNSDVAATLDEVLGPVPSSDELGDDAIAHARWLAEASKRELPAARWEAPSSMPLVRGAEMASFFIAGELADDPNREYWLDVLMPDSFDPYAVARARADAAALRGDDAASSAWTKTHRAMQERLSSFSALVLKETAFP